MLWHSDAPWAASAYGGQTRLVARSLREAGFEVVLSAAAGSEGGATVWGRFAVLPTPSHRPNGLRTWMEEVVDPHCGDVVVTLVNTWRLAFEDLAGQPVLSWTPVDSDPLPDLEIEHFAATLARPLSLSAFGAEQFLRAGFADVVEVKHGIDIDTFAPLASSDRQLSRRQARQQLGIDEDQFVVGVVAANDDAVANRKSFPEILGAVAKFAGVSDNVTLFLHTDLDGRPNGIDLRQVLAAQLQPEAPNLRVMATSAARYRRGVTEAELALMYNSFDVLCAPSAGEGFCLPLVEAQACGVPVIATDFAAQPENVHVGRLVAGQRRWDPSREVFLATPSVDGIADALSDLRSRGDADWREAVAFAASYSHDERFRTCWLPLLDG